MARSDPYADLDTYKARVNKTSDGDDTAIEAELLAVSDYVDRKLRVAELYFASSGATDTTRHLDGLSPYRRRAGYVDPAPELWLRAAGRQHCLRTVSSVEVDLSGDGTFTAIPAADYRLLPVDGDVHTSLEIYRSKSSRWPHGVASVKVAGTWGYAATPGAVVDLVVMATDAILRLEEAGPLLTYDQIDTAVSLAPGLVTRVRDLQDHYGWRLPVFA